MSHGLTVKQEKFCTEYLQCGNASKAYRAAYNAGKMKDVTVNRNAFALLQNDKIATRIDQLRAESAKIAVLDKAMILDDLMKIKDEAMEPDSKGVMTDAQAAIRALELLGKHLNLWQPDTMVKVEINSDREPFEKILERAIIIDGGLPDFEDRKRRDIGMLYERWSRGEKIEDNPIIGGLGNPFEIDGYLLTTETPISDGVTISGGDGSGFIVAPKRCESVEEWEQIANAPKE